MALALVHQTPAQFAQRLRAAYRAASKEQCARMAWRIVEMLNAGDVTDAQLQNVFGLTAAQYPTLKTKLADLHDKWAGVRAAQGE